MILTIFTIWSSLCFVSRYSAVLIITALYVASVYNRPLHHHHHHHHTVSCHRPSVPATSPLKTKTYPHHPTLNFHTAALSVLCVMFQVQLSFVLNLLIIFLFCISILAVSCSSCHWPHSCCFSK